MQDHPDGRQITKTLTGQELIVFNLFFLGRGKAAFPDPTPKFTKKSYQFKGWCYFPSVGTEIKCNNSLFSVRMDGNLYAYIRYFPSLRYFPSVGMENYS